MLAEHAFCQTCRTRLAYAVDHVQPHGGHEDRFFDVDNLAALCLECHGRKTRAGQ